jgi:glycosyltransferase involved in cell wall biosynthesis
MAASNGWRVKLLYLSSSTILADVEGFHEVRKFHLFDIWRLKGVVHTHGFRPDFVGWIFSWFPGCITVNTLHGHFPQHLNFDYPKWKVCLAWFFWSRLLYRFDLCVCLSRAMLRHYRRVLPNLRSSFAYNFRSLPKDQKKNKSFVDSNISQWIGGQRIQGRIVLAYAGSLTSRKNVISLVRAVSKCSEFSLILCGDGPLKQQLVSEIKNSDRERILLAGHLDRPEAIIALSDMLVLPSFAEGLPLAILEAAQFGVPSLMSNIAVHRELATNGLGLTFNHHNYYDFHQKVFTLLKYRSDEFDLKLKSIWLEKFSPEIGFSQYEKLFLSFNSKNSH